MKSVLILLALFSVVSSHIANKFLPPIFKAPSSEYLPPTNQHYSAPIEIYVVHEESIPDAPTQNYHAEAPSNNYLPPVVHHSPAPLSNNVQQQHYAPAQYYQAPTQNYHAAALSNNYLPPVVHHSPAPVVHHSPAPVANFVQQQHYAPAQSYQVPQAQYLPPQTYHVPINQRTRPVYEAPIVIDLPTKYLPPVHQGSGHLQADGYHYKF